MHPNFCMRKDRFRILNIVGTVMTLNRPIDTDMDIGDDVTEIDISLNFTAEHAEGAEGRCFFSVFPLCSFYIMNTDITDLTDLYGFFYQCRSVSSVEFVFPLFSMAE